MLQEKEEQLLEKRLIELSKKDSTVNTAMTVSVMLRIRFALSCFFLWLK